MQENEKKCDEMKAVRSIDSSFSGMPVLWMSGFSVEEPGRTEPSTRCQFRQPMSDQPAGAMCCRMPHYFYDIPPAPIQCQFKMRY
jgi:hypothetical protein